MLLCEVRVNLNTEQEALVEQLRLPEIISIKEAIMELEKITIMDKEAFDRNFQ